MMRDNVKIVRTPPTDTAMKTSICRPSETMTIQWWLLLRMMMMIWYIIISNKSTNHNFNHVEVMTTTIILMIMMKLNQNLNQNPNPNLNPSQNLNQKHVMFEILMTMMTILVTKQATQFPPLTVSTAWVSATQFWVTTPPLSRAEHPHKPSDPTAPPHATPPCHTCTLRQSSKTP